MKDRYLFKAKRKDNKEWVYGYIVIDKMNYSDNETGEDIYYIAGNSDVYVEVIPSTIGQYTGLTDKNGKKIFENDIVRGNGYFDDNDLFIIKYGKYKTDDWKKEYGIYHTYQFGFYGEFLKGKNQVHLVSPNGIEVIGNIFDEEAK